MFTVLSNVHGGSSGSFDGYTSLQDLIDILRIIKHFLDYELYFFDTHVSIFHVALSFTALSIVLFFVREVLARAS